MSPISASTMLSPSSAGRLAAVADAFCGTPVPGRSPVPIGPSTLLERIGLNPQPLPPKDGGAASGPTFGGRAVSFDDFEWCGTVPRHFPPPPPPGPWGDLVASALGR